MDAPPTQIIVHRQEKTRKCTVWPLRGRPGFVFHRFPLKQNVPTEGYVRLGLGGPLLGPDDAEAGLLLLDATWRHVEAMDNAFAHVPVRSLPPWETAYPRVSKLFDDPEQGLASIEALFAAYVSLGRPTDGLLDHYHWKDDFLERNRSRLPRTTTDYTNR